jgi:glycosyltransferase involved in cell wall biosynthesis
MKILHIINSLKKGGAEGNLYRLCKFQQKKYHSKIKIIIITLVDNGFFESKLRKMGIRIYSLKLNKKNKFFYLIKKIHLLRKYISNQNPDIIQSWMYHSNFLTLFIPKKFYNRVFWNIRHSELNFKISKKMTIFLSLICGVLSRIIPKKIIYCSERSIEFHEKKHAYSKNKTVLIYNGYDHKSYFPSKRLRMNFRKRYKIKKTQIVLGYAGRYAKQKNIPSLLFAFSKVVKKYKNIYLFMAGKDINLDNKELVNHIKKIEIKNKVIFLSEQKNLLEFYNGIDLLTLTSLSESFPNVVPESMLCSTPVLSSNAGCSKKIINNCGFVMKNNNVQSIFRNLDRVIQLQVNNKKNWKILKKKTRLQIIKNFSISNMSNEYLQNWAY